MGSAEDPYKKYWLAILIGFVLTGAWLCLPIMETSVGSAHVDTSKPAVDPNAAGSLDAVDNPSGAQGFALSLDGTRRKSKSDEPIESMLYQAPPEVASAAAASGAPLGAAAGSPSSLAQQLKDLGDKKAASGGWGEKAQRGFSAPRLGSSLSGTGGTSGGAGASASSGVSAFGSSNAQIGYGATRGLRDDGASDRPVGGVAALRRIASQTQQAAANRSGDGAVAGNSRVFDGSKAREIGAPTGADLAGGYAALDSAPANLKLNDTKLDKKEIKEPTAVDVPKAASSGDDTAKQLAITAASIVIGGLIGGTAGTMVMTMAQTMIQQQQSQAAAEKSKANLAASNGKINATTSQ